MDESFLDDITRVKCENLLWETLLDWFVRMF